VTKIAASLFAGALLLAAAPALAQEEAPPKQDDNSLSIGLGGGFAPTYEGSDDYRIIPAGVVRGKIAGHSFFTRGLQLYFDAIPEADGPGFHLGLGPVVGLRLNRTSSIKDPRVKALGELDTAFEAGGFVSIGQTGVITSDYDNLSFRVTYLKDVGNAHESHIITPSIEYGTPLSRQAFVGLSLSADFVGEGYADYYFDVSPAGSIASGLAPYDADGGFKSWSLTLAGAHALTGDLLGGLSLFAVGSYTRLRGDFADSPIVSTAGSATQWFGAVGLSYSF
jgi:outer membrane scaffolding protein for murein synthesis (MipA/OmpV family)